MAKSKMMTGGSKGSGAKPFKPKSQPPIDLGAVGGSAPTPPLPKLMPGKLAGMAGKKKTSRGK